MVNKPPRQIFQIKVTLDDTRPPIWRRILVPANTTLLKLHDILQIVMGWEGYRMLPFGRWLLEATRNVTALGRP